MTIIRECQPCAGFSLKVDLSVVTIYNSEVCGRGNKKTIPNKTVGEEVSVGDE